MTRAERLGVFLIALPPALISLVLLLVFAALSFGQALGGLFEVIGGANLTRSWWVQGRGFELLALLTLAAQLLVTRALARRLAEPARQRAFGRFGLLVAVLLILTPALIGNLPQLLAGHGESEAVPGEDTLAPTVAP